MYNNMLKINIIDACNSDLALQTFTLYNYFKTIHINIGILSMLVLFFNGEFFVLTSDLGCCLNTSTRAGKIMSET